MPQAKKIANPEYVKLSKELKTAQTTSKKRQAAMVLAYAAVKAKESEIVRLEKTIESHREKLSGLIERAEDFVSASKDATTEVSSLIDRMKETSKTITQD